MSGSLVIYQQNGQRFANGEIECTYTRSNVINAIGVAKIDIPISESKLTEDMLSYGNFIVIDDDRYGIWGGMLWTPYQETEDTISLTAFTMEKVFAQRRATPGKIDGSAGDIFASLIDMANAAANTHIVKGTIDRTGLIWSEVVGNETIYDVLIRVASNSNQYWNVAPSFTNTGRLRFIANWQSRIGKDYNIRLIEGKHFVRPQGPALVDDGDIANDIMVVGNSGTSTPLTARQIDGSSVAKYGLRQATITVDSADQNTLNVAATALVSLRAFPQRSHRLYLIDEDTGNGTAAFDFAHIGDTFILSRPGHGFQSGRGGIGNYEARVQILAREYNATDGRMALVVREVMQ